MMMDGGDTLTLRDLGVQVFRIIPPRNADGNDIVTLEDV